MGSGWSNDAPRSVTAPSDAMPGSARIVLGDDVPPQIAIIDGVPIVAAIIWYNLAPADDRYHFYAIGDGASTPIVRGTVIGNTVAVIDKHSMTLVGGQLIATIGSFSGGGTPRLIQRYMGTRQDLSDAITGPAGAPVFIDGVAAPRGTRLFVAAPGNPLASSTGAEVIAATSPDPMTFYRGHAYRCRLRARVVSTLAGQAGMLRLRAGTAFGSLGLHAFNSTVNGETRVDEFIVSNGGLADITSQVQLTLSGGTVANPLQISGVGTLQAEFEIEHAGDVGSFPGATQVA